MSTASITPSSTFRAFADFQCLGRTSNPLLTKSEKKLYNDGAGHKSRVRAPAQKPSIATPTEHAPVVKQKPMLDAYRDVLSGFRAARRAFVQYSPETQALKDGVKQGLKEFHKAEKNYLKALKRGETDDIRLHVALMKLPLSRAVDSFDPLVSRLEASLDRGNAVREKDRNKQVHKMMDLQVRMKKQLVELQAMGL